MSGHDADTARATDTDTAITVTTAEAARLAGVSARTIRRWIQQGWLSSIDGPNGQQVFPGDLADAAQRARQGRGHDRDHRHATPVMGAATDTDTAITARGQLDAIMREWLAPLVDRIGTLERENGRLEAEREELRRRAEAAEVELSATRLAYEREADELRSQASPAPPSAAPPIPAPVATPDAPAPAQGLWRRLRRALGGE